MVKSWLSYTVDLTRVLNRHKAEKLRSDEADAAGMTSDNFTMRTTSVSRRLTPTFEFSASAISVTVKIEDLCWLLSSNKCKIYELRLC